MSSHFRMYRGHKEHAQDRLTTALATLIAALATAAYLALSSGGPFQLQITSLCYGVPCTTSQFVLGTLALPFSAIPTFSAAAASVFHIRLTNPLTICSTANCPSRVSTPYKGISWVNPAETVSNFRATRKLTCKNIENVLCVDSENTARWAGSDIGAWLDSAYAALPAAGGTIWVVPNLTNSCYNFSTPVRFSTVGKPVQVRAMATNVCLNFTPTGGTSVAITAISEAGNVVTAASSLNPAVGTNITISGYTSASAAYNGTFVVQSSSGTQFTVNNNISGLAGTGAGTAQVTQTAITLDWTAIGGGFYPPAGFEDFLIQNQPCGTDGGCSHATVGINWGPTHGGGEGAKLEGVTLVGWGVGEQVNNGWSYEIQRDNVTYSQNTFGAQTIQANEMQDWKGGSFFGNQTAVALQQTGARFQGVEFDNQTGWAITSDNVGTVSLIAPHFENFQANPPMFYNGSEDLDIVFGDALDDGATGNVANWFVGNVVNIYGLRIGSSGRTVSNGIALVQQGGSMWFSDATPSILTSGVICPGFSTTTNCGYFAPAGTAFWNTPKLGLGTAASPLDLVASGAGGQTITLPTPPASAQLPESPNLLISPTAPTITGVGCQGSAASIASNNGTASFRLNVGTTPTSACTVTMPTATTGWNCPSPTDFTTPTTTNVVKQTGGSKTSVVFSNYTSAGALTNFTANDVLIIAGCAAF